MRFQYHTALLFLLVLLSACRGTGLIEPDNIGDLTNIAYNPIPLTLFVPDSFPPMVIPADNPFTEAGVELGRMLFYDPILSADSTQSCSSCHLTKGSFTDNLAVSTGIDQIAGRRSSMSLLNVGYYNKGLFWDNRSKTLEEQALLPVEDPIELHNTWPNVVSKLKQHKNYPTHFRQAFGITNVSDITKELAAKALAQFERTLVSSGTSKFDKYFKTKDTDIFTETELDGFLLFNDKGGPLGLPDAECFHCHSGILFTSNEVNNNGLDSVQNFEDFMDKGVGGATGILGQNGKFRIPTLRNIALTAPYMHDGRFATLEEVIDHYSSGGHPSPGKDALVHRLGIPPNPQGLTAYQKKALLDFLHTLTDTAFAQNPKYQNPF